MLTTHAEFERWLLAPTNEALDLQRPLANEDLMVVATGKRADG
jgi:putative SOS response-associated peptidase YedK